MEDTSVGAFFNELISDEIQRMIMRLVSENLKPEQMLERLLEVEGKEESD